MHCTWVLGAVLVTLSFIISGVALLLGVFWYDTCHFINIVTSDFNQYVPSATAAKGLNACFNDTPLVEAFNMTQQLNFGGKLDAVSAKLNTLHTTQAYANLSAPIENLDHTLTAYNSTPAMLALNQYTNHKGYNPTDLLCVYSDTYTWVNIDTPWNDNIGKGSTSWSGELYARSGAETAQSYLTRLYQDANCGAAINDGVLDAWSSASTNVRHDCNLN